MAYGAVMFVRLWHRRDLRIINLQLRREGRIMPWGWAFAATALVMNIFSAHSALIRYHEVAARRAADAVMSAAAQGETPNDVALSSAISHLQFCHQWGLVRPDSMDERLATLWLLTDSPQRAEPHIHAILSRAPAAVWWRLKLASILLVQNRADEAILQLRSILRHVPLNVDDSHHARRWRAAAHEMLGDIFTALDDPVAAIAEYRRALVENPGSDHAIAALAALDAAKN